MAAARLQLVISAEVVKVVAFVFTVVCLSVSQDNSSRIVDKFRPIIFGRV